jgi:hypothetical protein
LQGLRYRRARICFMTAFDRFWLRCSPLLGVIAGLDPAIQHVGASSDSRQGWLDRRVEPGDDC